MTRKATRRNTSAQRTTYSMWHEVMASPDTPTPEHLRRHQLTVMWQGLRTMETASEPGNDDWRVVSDAVNFLETLVLQMRVCEDTSGVLTDAVRAMALAGQRKLQGGAIRLDGPGIQAVRAVLEDYAAVLAVLPHRTMVQCHRLTEQRIRQIWAGHGRSHDVQVVAI